MPFTEMQVLPSSCVTLIFSGCAADASARSASAIARVTRWAAPRRVGRAVRRACSGRAQLIELLLTALPVANRACGGASAAAAAVAAMLAVLLRDRAGSASELGGVRVAEVRRAFNGARW